MASKNRVVFGLERDSMTRKGRWALRAERRSICHEEFAVDVMGTRGSGEDAAAFERLTSPARLTFS